VRHLSYPQLLMKRSGQRSHVVLGRCAWWATPVLTRLAQASALPNVALRSVALLWPAILDGSSFSVLRFSDSSIRESFISG
jgi:hypothetical protein